MSGLCSGGAADAFALVTYLPEPLAGFVNRVRHELAPGCRLRAHITILPPRRLSCDAAMASREIENAAGQARAFRIEVEEIKVFQVSEVVYLSIGTGSQELKDLHARLNQGRCQASELWSYQPHVTLAQDLPQNALLQDALPQNAARDSVSRARGLAERRWREYAGPRAFTLDKLVFVQGSADRGWVDLTTWELPSPVLA